MSALARVKAKLAALRRDEESGAALLEFAIVFPAQLFITLAVMQFSLIFIAHIVVNHAAFAAARAALTADVPRARGATLMQDPEAANNAARHAAALVLGTIARNEGDNHGVRADALSWRDGSGQEVRIDQEEGAYGKTQVTVMPDNPDDHYIAVRVQHDYVLWIPVANHFFAGLPAFGSEGTTPNPAIDATGGHTAMRITKVGFVPRPWRAVHRWVPAGGAPADHPNPPSGP